MEKRKLKKIPQPSQVARIREHMKTSSRKRKLLYGIAGILFIWAGGMFITGAIYQRQHRNDQPLIGTSFAKAAAEDLGVDWRANYIALLDDLQIRQFRLMSYWEEIEPKQGT